MTFYDVSMEIHPEMMVYKNKDEKRPKITHSQSLQPHFVSETSLQMNLHTGTHMDFPLHMMENGKTSDDFLAHSLCRNVRVIDLSYVKDFITKNDLVNHAIQQHEMIFFKTQNSLDTTFNPHFIALGLDAAQYLKEQKIFAVGIDALGIERGDAMHQTHITLMNASIYIIEGLRLKDVKEGMYTCIALPLNIKGSDALPLRVILHD
jgi:arylformamidase